MDIEALRTFMAVHQTGGFSSAADRLGRSQPAISRRIALLEAALGAPLFERMPGGVTLSSAGRALLPHAERILAAVREGEDAMAELHGKGGEVALAAVGTLAGSMLTALLRRFALEHPRVRLSIRTATSAGVSDLVRRGEATIGLRYLLDPSGGVVCERVAAEPLRVVCSPAHPLAGKRLAWLVELKDEQWLAFPNAFEHRETFADNVFSQFQSRGVGAVRWTPVDSLTAQKRMIEAGFGLALLPDNALDEELRRGSLALIEVGDFEASHPVFVVVREGGYLSPAAQALLKLLRTEPDFATARTHDFSALPLGVAAQDAAD